MDSHSKPMFGFAQYPHIDSQPLHYADMAIMDVAQRNFVAWRLAHPEAGTLKQIALKAGVGFGTTQRLFAGDGNITVEKLEAIARVFHRSATDLLTEGKSGDGQPYAVAAAHPLHVIDEPPAEERQLLLGFRAASDEMREVMLEVARRCLSRREPKGRSDHQ